MESPTRHFHRFIRQVAVLSRSFDGSEEGVQGIKTLVESLDPTVLQRFLPGALSRFVQPVLQSLPSSSSSGILYKDVYCDPFLHVNAFGFLKAELKLPLHDHPGQNAIMKVFQGSVRIRSFSILEGGGEELPTNSIMVKYEGETVVASGHNSAVVGPKKGNIHELISLEPHTYFCDFFIPYTPVCYYYRPQLNDINESLVIGSQILMKRIKCPRDFVCGKLDFPSYEQFDFSDDDD